MILEKISSLNLDGYNQSYPQNSTSQKEINRFNVPLAVTSIGLLLCSLFLLYPEKIPNHLPEGIFIEIMKKNKLVILFLFLNLVKNLFDF